MRWAGAVLLLVAAVAAAPRMKRDQEWMTADQKAEVTALHASGDLSGMKDKIMSYYSRLPADRQATLNQHYKMECAAWIKTVASEEEQAELKALYDKQSVGEMEKKVIELKTRLSDEKRKEVDVWEPECRKLWTPKARLRRDAGLKELIAWLTEEQQAEVAAMKAGGSSSDDIEAKINGFFQALDAGKQATLKEEYKAKCKAYFARLATPQELEKMKAAHEAGNDDEATKISNEVIARQDAASKPVAEKYQKMCKKVFSRRRRDIDGLMNKHLSWLTPEQKAEVKKMKDEGAAQEEMRAKIMSYLKDLDAPSKKARSEQMQKDCYKWLHEVASQAEVDALHKMHETDHDGCKKQVRVFLARLPEERQVEVKKHLPFCERLWYGEHGKHDHGHGHHGHHHIRRAAPSEGEQMFAFLSWMTPQQIQVIKDAQAKGDKETVFKKIMEFYNTAEGDAKTKATESMQAGCRRYIKNIVGPDNSGKLHRMKESGASNAAMAERVKEMIAAIPDANVRAKGEKIAMSCQAIFGESRRRRHEHHDFEQIAKDYLGWLTPEQMAEVKQMVGAGNKDQVYAKVVDYYTSISGDVKAKATEQMRGGCRHFLSDLIGSEKVAEIKALKESGASRETIMGKIQAFVAATNDEEKQMKADKLVGVCKHVFDVAAKRRKRDEHSLQKAFDQYLTWTTDAQKAELKSLLEAGDRGAIYKKTMEFYKGLSGDAKTKATEQLKGACKHFIKSTFGDAKAEQLKDLKENLDATNEEIEAMINGWILAIEDGNKKERAQNTVGACKIVFTEAKRRLRRDESALNKAFEQYLSWTTDSQKAELKSLLEAGDRGAIYKKTMEYYQALSGDAKTKATEQLKGACKHFIKTTFGEAKAEQLKDLKENLDASNEEIEAMINGWILAIEDGDKKERAQNTVGACKVVFATRRFRRHEFDHMAKEYLNWLSGVQLAEVKALRDAGDKEGATKKVLEFYAQTSGDLKAKATEQLKGGCKHYIGDIIGEANTAELKTLKESGASNEEMYKKVLSYVDAVADPTEKERGLKAVEGCKTVFAVSKRLRRHNFEHMAKEYLGWLTAEQMGELKTLKDGGDKGKIPKKIMEFYGQTTGELKEKATQQLQGGCKHYVTEIIGEDNVSELKTLKESGASNEEMYKKVIAFMNAVTDENQKEKGLKIVDSCKVVFAAAKRMRRHEFDHMAKEYLNWLNEAQLAEIKTLRESDKDAAAKKIMEFYHQTSGDAKAKATEQLKGGCKHVVTDIIGEDKAAELKTLKESGASNEEMYKKVIALLEDITDPAQKAKGLKIVDACKVVFAAPHRHRRAHHHDLDELLNTYLSWLNDDQINTLKELKASGDKQAMYDKVMEFFEASEGAIKEKATEQLQAGCKHYIKDILGEEKAAQLKALKESGASMTQIGQKVEEFIEAIDNPDAKQHALRASTACKKVFLSRRMRSTGRSGQQTILNSGKIIRHVLFANRGWFSREQHQKLEQMKNENLGRAVIDKVLEFYNGLDNDKKTTATSRLQATCRAILEDYVGKEKIDELIRMKVALAPTSQLVSSLDSMFTSTRHVAEVQHVKQLCMVAYENTHVETAGGRT